MRYFKEVLVDIAKLPVAIEEKLPAGAPKVSDLLINAANKIPQGPGSPIEIPELPTPMLPALPSLPGGGGALGLAPRPTGARGKVTEETPPRSYVGSRGKL